jgi:hypothetical protein
MEWDTIQQKPTAITGSAEEKRRPWIESIEGATNLPDGLDTVTAMRCLAPQGINGCGFESHLESMYLALSRANKAEEDEVGFLRDNAILSVVFVTDEADCSMNKEWNTIFDRELDGGNEVFWSIPGEVSPSSAVCWNAGVTCEPAGASTYDSCVPANKDFEGNPVSDAEADANAVLYPLRRYIDRVSEIERAKQDLNPGQELLIAAILGVPPNYPTGEITYTVGQGANDPTSFQAQFGIAPGCSAEGLGEAVPPVRMKAFADEFLISDDDVNLFSVCSPSFEAALDNIANAIRDQIRPACMRACVADVDAVTEGLQPQCVLTESYRDDTNTLIENEIPECGANDTLPDGEDVCYAPLTDQNNVTGATSDDMSPECIEEGWNLEFRLVRREGVAAPGGAQASATCQLSQNKQVDCPGLPG